MNKPWPIGPLSDIADVIMGQSPDGSSTNNFGEGLPLLNGPTEFGRFHPTPMQWTTSGARLADPEDILFCVRGSTTGRMNTADQQYAIGRGLCAIRAKSASDSDFIRYALSHTLPNLLSAVTGSVFPNLSKPQIGEHAIPIPPSYERERISEVLGAFDDKVASNYKASALADALIRAKFDLLSSRSRETRLISDVAMLRRDTVDPSILQTDVPYVGLEHLPRRIMWLDTIGSSEQVSSNKSQFQAGDILFGKLRPYFHKVVTVATSGICSTDILVLKPKESELSGFVLAALTRDAVVQEVTSLSEGTRMPRTNWKDLSKVEVPWFGDVESVNFSREINTIRSAMISLLEENQTLTHIRDSLLPLLMLGKVHFKDVRQLVESVV